MVNFKFQVGERVETPFGPGKVNYVRLGTPRYAEVTAVSVTLDYQQRIAILPVERVKVIS